MVSDIGVSATDVRNGEAGSLAKQEQGVVVDRVFKTICLLVCYLIMGMASPLVGNTLVHLGRLFDVSTATMSFTVAVQAVSSVLGAILCGIVFDRVNHELAFAVALVIKGLATILASFIGGLVPFMVAMGIHTMSTGFENASGQSYCVGLWAGHGYRGPIVQATHAVWSLGGTLSPIINARFLVDLPQQQQQQQQNQTASAANKNQTMQYSIDTYDVNLTIRNLTPAEAITYAIDASDVSGVANVRYAYVTIGSLILVASCLFIIAYLRSRLTGGKRSSGTTPSSPHPKNCANSKPTAVNVDREVVEHPSSRPESCFKEAATEEGLDKRNWFIYLIFLILLFLFTHLYRNSEIIPISYMTTFAVKYLNFSIQDASLLMSLFYGFIFAGRVLGILVAGCIRPRTMLIVNLSLTAVSFVLLLALVNVWTTIIWISAPLASLSMSTTFATTVLWISDRVPITGRISSILLAGFSSGAITGPLIVSQLFEALSPMWFVYVVVISSLSNLVLFLVIVVFDDRWSDRVKSQATVGLNTDAAVS